MIGLVQKFKVERNVEPYPEHEGRYFVLFPDEGSYPVEAAEALYVFAAAVQAKNPELAQQLKAWLDGIHNKRLGR